MNYDAFRKLAAGLAKKAPRDDALALAQRNAAKPVSEGGLGLRPDNTAMERARAMGYTTPGYHATNRDFTALDVGASSKSAAFGPGVYTSASPEDAGRWAKTKEGARVLPLLTRQADALPMAPLSSRDASKLSDFLGRAIPEGSPPPLWTLENRAGSVSEGAQKAGFSGVEHAGPGAGVRNMVFTDPSNIRSRFAAFDPARRKESDLLAGVAPYAAPAAVVGAGALAPTEESEAGIAGVLAKTANLDMLKVAMKAEETGLPAARIYDATGWARGADGKWRWEFDDSAAKLGNDALDLRRYERKGAKFVLDDLGNTLQNPQAYAAYPDLKGVQVQHNLGGIPGEGMYSPASDRITVEGSTLGHATGDIKPVLGHETAHTIQEREGFAKGGDPKEFLRESNSIKRDLEDQIDAINSQLSRAVGTPRYSELMDLRSELVADLRKQGLLDPIGMREAAHGKYRKLAGEVEARNVEGRMGMSADDRRMRPFMDTEDVPRGQQIVRGVTGEPAASMSKSEALRALRAYQPKKSGWGMAREAATELANPINFVSGVGRSIPQVAAIEAAVMARELDRPEDLVYDEATGEWLTPEQADLARQKEARAAMAAELLQKMSDKGAP